MAGSFRKATRYKLKARIAICGPTGSGKTATAVRWAMALGWHMARQQNRAPRIAFIDTEEKSASKYVGQDFGDGYPVDFDVCELASFSPTKYTELILEAGRANYDVIVIDSLSHAWMGTDGALELKDKSGSNSFTAWKTVTPMHNRMIDSIIRSPAHVISTMRSKMEYILEEGVSQSGKPIQVPRKVGMAPIQRAGMEYEFDVVADMDWSHTLTVSKSRCTPIDGAISVKPGAAFLEPLIYWLEQGSEIPQSVMDAAMLATEAEVAAAWEASGERRPSQEGGGHGGNGSGGNGNGHAANVPADPLELARQAAARRQAAQQPASNQTPAVDPDAARRAMAQAQVDAKIASGQQAHQADMAANPTNTNPAPGVAAEQSVSHTTVESAAAEPNQGSVMPADPQHSQGSTPSGWVKASPDQVKTIQGQFKRMGYELEQQEAICANVFCEDGLTPCKHPSVMSQGDANDLIDHLAWRESELLKEKANASEAVASGSPVGN